MAARAPEGAARLSNDNGSPRRVSDHVLHQLAAVMAEAKAGNVHAVAIVAVGPDGRPLTRFGGDGALVPCVNLGLDIIKATFMSQIVEAPNAVQLNSGLVVPGRDN